MPVRILSLSGGGIRGIFQAVFLREIALQLGTPLRDNFELIAGTSTGALIALGVALDVDSAKIVDLFEKHGSEIFPENKRRVSQWTISYATKGAVYDQTSLQAALTEVFTGKNGAQLQLKDCKPAVVIPATTLNRYRMRSFTVLERCGAPASMDGELFAADVALASSAAPIFFPAYRPRGRRASNEQIRTEERTYVDGALWANNPVLQAVMTARRCWGTDFADMRIVSIGNGEIPAGLMHVDFNNMRRAKMLKPIMDMMFATQSELADETVGTLLDDPLFSGARMLRINTQLDVPIELDDVKSAIDRLKPLAEAEARSSIGKFRSLLQA
jgi:patatin-like phospholipase/acyl hydrolase